MTPKKIVDNEFFEPTALQELFRFFRSSTKATDCPHTIHVFSRAWMLVTTALEGNGLDTEDLIDVVNDLEIEILNPNVFKKAEAEAKILKARDEAGLCLGCGVNHQTEDRAHPQLLN